MCCRFRSWSTGYSFLSLGSTERQLFCHKSIFCCLCQGPNEAHLVQRQQTCLRWQDFAASAEDPMKPTLFRGSKHASGSRILLLPPKTQCCSLCSKAANMPQVAGFCCFRRRPHVAHFAQRQQTCLRWQDFAASEKFAQKRWWLFPCEILIQLTSQPSAPQMPA